MDVTFHIIRIIIFGVTTFLLAFLFAPTYIRMLEKLKFAKQLRVDASLGTGKAKQFQKLHKHKAGTPTMGGMMILLIVFAMVGFSIVMVELSKQIGLDLRNSLFNRNETYLVLFTLVTIGFLGGIDDYLNIKGIGKNKGMSERVKLIGLSLFALAGAWWFFVKLGYDSVSIPFFGLVNIGAWYILVFIFMILAMANSVNVTDGLDGLVGGLLMQNYLLYAFITFDQELFLLSTLCIVICGAIMAFLWFNIKPAKFYMGDSGSLPLGAGLAIMAMMTDTLVVLFIVSLVYVWEIVTVIIQLTSKKLRNGKKIFKIAPYHHHLEACGLSEETIVMRFWLLGIILSSIGVVVYVLIK